MKTNRTKGTHPYIDTFCEKPFCFLLIHSILFGGRGGGGSLDRGSLPRKKNKGPPLEYWGGSWSFLEINIFVGKMGEINKWSEDMAEINILPTQKVDINII